MMKGMEGAVVPHDFECVNRLDCCVRSLQSFVSNEVSWLQDNCIKLALVNSSGTRVA